MSRSLILAVVILLPILALTVEVGAPSPPGQVPEKGEGSYVPGEVIIRFQDSTMREEREGTRDRIGASRIRPFRSGAEHWRLPPGLEVARAIELLARNPRVRYAEPNYVVTMDTVPDDPRLAEQWSLINTGQGGGVPDADIDADQAWDLNTGSHDVVAAVIDAGIDCGHDDLVENCWRNPDELPNGLDDDGNGYVDDFFGWDFLRDDNDPSPFDIPDPQAACEFTCNHGTHVAGIAGAVGDNGEGIVGVSWSVSLMRLRIAGAGCFSTTADAIEAIEYATEKGADVINASWGIGTTPSQALEDAIAAAGQVEIAFVAAAGNHNSDNDAVPRYPSSYTLENIISVAATDRNDLKGPGSNYGLTSVDLGAPGIAILSTIPGLNCPPCEVEPCPPGGPRYALNSGTSMAAPHVSGALGLLRAANPGVAVTCMKEILLSSTDPLPDLAGRTVSGGRLNAFQALQEVEADGDLDGVPDLCDNCPTDYNPGQGFVGDPVVQVLDPNGGEVLQVHTASTLSWTASDTCGGVSSVDLLISRNGASGSFSPIALGVQNTGSFAWTVTGPQTGNAFLKVVARDPAGNAGQDVSDGAFVILRLCTVCQGSYCSGEGVRCVAASACMVGGCCGYSCGADASCTLPDPCPENACGC